MGHPHAGTRHPLSLAVLARKIATGLPTAIFLPACGTSIEAYLQDYAASLKLLLHFESIVYYLLQLLSREKMSALHTLTGRAG